MAASIIGNAVDAWRGTLQGPKRAVMPFVKPGVDGSGIVVGGKHATPSEVETMTWCLDLSAAVTLKATYEALVGTIGSVTDDAGTTLDKCAILSVEAQILACTGHAVNAALLSARWTILGDAS